MRLVEPPPAPQPPPRVHSKRPPQVALEHGTELRLAGGPRRWAWPVLSIEPEPRTLWRPSASRGCTADRGRHGTIELQARPRTRVSDFGPKKTTAELSPHSFCRASPAATRGLVLGRATAAAPTSSPRLAPLRPHALTPPPEASARLCVATWPSTEVALDHPRTRVSGQRWASTARAGSTGPLTWPSPRCFPHARTFARSFLTPHAGGSIGSCPANPKLSLPAAVQSFVPSFSSARPSVAHSSVHAFVRSLLALAPLARLLRRLCSLVFRLHGKPRGDERLRPLRVGQKRGLCRRGWWWQGTCAAC